MWLSSVLDATSSCCCWIELSLCDGAEPEVQASRLLRVPLRWPYLPLMAQMVGLLYLYMEGIHNYTDLLPSNLHFRRNPRKLRLFKPLAPPTFSWQLSDASIFQYPSSHLIIQIWLFMAATSHLWPSCLGHMARTPVELNFSFYWILLTLNSNF